MWARIRAILFENLGLKLASLVLSFLVYAHVVTEQERESVVQIPIAAIGLADTLIRSGQLPTHVSVAVRGKWKDLIRLGLSRPLLSIDLAAAQPGAFRTSITADDIARRAIPPELSRQVSVTQVLDPRSVDLMIEPRATRMLPVRARIVGRPAEGFAVDGEPTVSPESVRVMGPRDAFHDVDTAYTVAVDITGEREKIQRRVPLGLPSDLVNLGAQRCLVTIRLAKAEPESATTRRERR